MKVFKNRTVLGATCILLSLILSFGIAPLLGKSASEKTSIVRIAKDVPLGEAIKADQVETVEVGAYHLPTDVVKSADAVIGKYAAVELKKGDYLLPAKLSDQAPDAFAHGLNGNKLALSVTIKSLAAGLSGKLMAGDIITLIASDYGDMHTTSLPPELQYVEVLAVTTDSGTDAGAATTSKNTDEDAKQDLPSTLTLLVQPLQAQLLADLENKGKLHAALVYRGDVATAQAFIAKEDDFLTAKQGKTEGTVHE